MNRSCLTVVGGGLAGCEAAWQAARRGVEVELIEMRPQRMTAAHATGLLGELVCSNSLRSDDPLTAVGTLKAELRRLDSLVLATADRCRVPAGRSLAVDRERFARELTDAIAAHPGIQVRREDAVALPARPTVVATGPLTSPELSAALAVLFGQEALHFHDAIAPIVDAETLAPDSWFAASRYEETRDDYLNIPLSEPEYDALVSALAAAPVPERHEPAPGAAVYFAGCQPVEEMARSGRNTLRFGPMKPVGLSDPRTGRRPFAVIQLRRENLSGSLYNLVGFQTQLAIPDQERILRGLDAFRPATFLRHGSAHRNTYIASPRLLRVDLSAHARTDLRVAGQLAGVEGYVESAGCGLMAGLFAAIPGLLPPPPETVLGGLLRYITSPGSWPFQPMKANWGVVDEIRAPRDAKRRALHDRSLAALAAYAGALS